MSPRVSIVLPFRNQGALLSQACKSLQAQTVDAWECILVNDGSDTEAETIAEAVAKRDGRFKLISIPHNDHFPGPWLARNVGLASATSELIAFLDADDLWHPRKLERQLVLHSVHGIELSVTGYHRFEATSMKLVETRKPPLTLNLKALLRGNPVPFSSVIIQRDCLTQPFHPERHEDYGLWLRLFANDPPPRYGCLMEPLMAYRLHSSSLSSQRGRSIFAVEKLFRHTFSAPSRRLMALAAWALERAWRQTVAGVHRILWQDAKLPSPFIDYLASGSQLYLDDHRSPS